MGQAIARRIFIGLFFVLSCASGCSSPQYNYVPVTQTSQATEQKQEEGLYPVPPDSPQGSVRVRSLGVVNLRPRGENKKIPALSLRMDVTNTGGTASWKIDTREQVVLFPNKGQVQPIFVNSDSSSLPDIEVKPGTTRVIDLYFPLPGDAATGMEINGFEFKWAVQIGAQSFEQITIFQRKLGHDEIVHVYPYEPYPFGYGPIWWEYRGLPVWGPPVWTPPIRLRR